MFKNAQFIILYFAYPQKKKNKKSEKKKELDENKLEEDK
jgi:hypothetical protein